MSGFQSRLDGWRVMIFFEIHLEWDIHIMGIYSRVGISMKYITLWLFNIAMENGPFIDGLPIENSDFPWLC